jgi:hypothetical protein
LFDAPLPHFRLKDASLPPTLCPHCNKNLALVGLRHNCTPGIDPVVVHANKVVHKGSSRHGKYADAEKRKEYRRVWMRKKRAGAPST